MIIELSERSKQIFRQIVDAYVETGEPIGSRTIARRPDQHLSPATHPQRHGRSRGCRPAVTRRTPRPAACRPIWAFGCTSTACSRSGNLNEEERARDRQPCRRCRAQPRGDARRCQQRALGPVALSPAWCLRPRSSVRSSRSSSSRSARAARWSSWSPTTAWSRTGSSTCRSGIGASRPGRGRQLSDRAPGRPLASPRRASRSNARSASASSELDSLTQQGGRGRARASGAAIRPPTRAC